MKKGDGAKRPKTFFAYRRKALFIPGCVQGAIIEIVFTYVCVCACNICCF